MGWSRDGTKTKVYCIKFPILEVFLDQQMIIGFPIIDSSGIRPQNLESKLCSELSTPYFSFYLSKRKRLDMDPKKTLNTNPKEKAWIRKKKVWILKKKFGS